VGDLGRQWISSRVRVEVQRGEGSNVVIRFRGEHIQKVDDKCRLSIPSAFRQALEAHGDSRLVLCKSMIGSCIQVYTAGDWEKVEDKIAALPPSDPTVRNVRRFQVASNVMAEPDGHGRVLLPAALRVYAGIAASTEVVIASQINWFEVWQKDRWDAEQDRIEGDLPQWSNDLARLGL